MSPPAEQLLRDYLNRLQVAARGQLGSRDRRVLVDRTREFIERKTGASGPPAAMEVARLLSGLGDPAGLVSQERQRLAGLRGEAVEPVSRGRLARVLHGDPGKVRGASWHWPVQPGSRVDLQVTLINGDTLPTRRTGAEGATASLAAGRPAAAGGARQPALSPDAPRGGEPGRPQWPAGAAGTAGDGLARQHTGQGAGEGQVPGPDNGAAAPAAEPAGAGPATAQLASPAAPLSSRGREFLTRVAGWSRRNKLEAVAVTLLGLGGVIFPPVWLLGAAVALASRLWDYRDKWVGLALPVLLTVIGTAVGVALGSRASFGHGMHEGWVLAVDTSRAVAVLGACYLGWRGSRGPRPPAVPPWDKPHRVG